jgi:hypothetical protein
MATEYTSTERNAYRDFANGRVARVRLFDTAAVQRYDQAIQSKTIGDLRIQIVQTLLAADLNGFNIAQAQIINSNGSIAGIVTFVPTLDKRPTSPTFNLPVDILLTMRY